MPKNPMSKSYPSFTFRGVKPIDFKHFVPGPGAYDSTMPTRLSMRAVSAPSISIAFKPDDPALKERKPGPQAYTLPKETRGKPSGKPATTMKFRHEGNGYTHKDPGPGPMEYMDRIYLKQIYCPGSVTTKKARGFHDKCESCCLYCTVLAEVCLLRGASLHYCVLAGIHIRAQEQNQNNGRRHSRANL